MTEATPAARLVWERPDGTTAEFPLADRPLLVGRDEEADVRVAEALVSRAHARIEPRPGGHAVLDLGSTNLTRVNGEVVRERVLADGDEIRFGRALCRYRLGDAPAAPSVADPVANGV